PPLHDALPIFSGAGPRRRGRKGVRAEPAESAEVLPPSAAFDLSRRSFRSRTTGSGFAARSASLRPLRSLRETKSRGLPRHLRLVPRHALVRQLGGGERGLAEDEACRALAEPHARRRGVAPDDRRHGTARAA